MSPRVLYHVLQGLSAEGMAKGISPDVVGILMIVLKASRCRRWDECSGASVDEVRI